MLDTVVTNLSRVNKNHWNNLYTLDTVLVNIFSKYRNENSLNDGYKQQRQSVNNTSINQSKNTGYFGY